MRRAHIARALLCLSLVASGVAGWLCASSRALWPVALLLELSTFAFLVVGLKLDFGAPSQLPGQIVFDFAVFGPAHNLVAVPVMWFCPKHLVTLLYPALAVWVFVIFVAGQRRSIAVAGSLSMLGVVLNTSGHITAASQVAAIAFVIKLQLVWLTLYARDQHVVITSAFLQFCVACCAGYVQAKNWRKAGTFAGVSVMLFYFFLIYLRRLRTLPRGLRAAKFVKLSYLRHLRAKGESIPRCQDMPKWAFGDVSKAAFLVSISHRWLNRTTCDAATEENPAGMRLITMLDRLEQCFSLRGLGKGAGIWQRARHLQASIAGGADVLVFFDWMSVPQDGVGKRSVEEEEVFRTVLPNMPSLYFCFDVCVVPEVPDGVEGYEKSGWCHAELTVARLGGRLDMLSTAFQHDPSRGSLSDIAGAASPQSSASMVLSRVVDDLADKVFTIESDKEIVRDLIRDFSRKRKVVKAVEQGDIVALETLLGQFQSHRLEAVLDSAVDDVANTPLHLAVQLRNVEAVQVLLSHGADPWRRNLRGDTAFQWFLWPRMGRAAFACYTKSKGPPRHFEGSVDPAACVDDLEAASPTSYVQAAPLVVVTSSEETCLEQCGQGVTSSTTSPAAVPEAASNDEFDQTCLAI